MKLYDAHKTQKELDWGSKDFIDMEKLRVQLLKELLKKHSCVFYLDVDIVVLNNIEYMFKTCARGKSDLYMQNDLNMPCMGCMLLYNHYSVIEMLDTLSQLQGDNSIQCYLRSVINHYGVKSELLPLVLFPNGLVFFGKESIIDSPTNNKLLRDTEELRSITKEKFDNNEVFLVHANYMTGLNNKKAAFKRFGLWYLD